jgi:hypothetical protein
MHDCEGPAQCGQVKQWQAVEVCLCIQGLFPVQKHCHSLQSLQARGCKQGVQQVLLVMGATAQAAASNKATVRKVVLTSSVAGKCRCNHKT